MYYLIHRNCDGAGIIEDEIITTDAAGLVRSIEHKRREYPTLDAAKGAANALQRESDDGGNPWGYAYSVHWGGPGYIDGTFYRTYPA